MDIEAIVKKYARLAEGMRYWDAEILLRAALTELSEAYEQRIDELAGVQITVGDGLVVYGSVEAIHRVQAYILLDSKHSVEARDTNRYFAKQLQAAEQRIRQLEVDKAEYDRRIVAVGGVAINSVSREYHDAEVARLNALYESAVKGRQDFREAYRRQLDGERVPEGLSVQQEPKYTTNGSAIVNRASGEAIPPDEPVFVFRARDIHAREALEAYACVIKPGIHRDKVCERIADFAEFAMKNKARMKQPDTAQVLLAAATRRCHLCDYQHGHKIGCVNNPVDIALRAAAPQPKKEE